MAVAVAAADQNLARVEPCSPALGCIQEAGGSKRQSEQRPEAFGLEDGIGLRQDLANHLGGTHVNGSPAFSNKVFTKMQRRAHAKLGKIT